MSMLLCPQLGHLLRETQALPCSDRKGGGPGGGGESGIRQLSPGNEPLSDGGAEMLYVLVTWPFC